MIISVLSGGIGNQLFQYAAGKALALSTDQAHQYLYDPRLNSIARDFALGNFRLTSLPAKISQVFPQWLMTPYSSLVTLNNWGCKLGLVQTQIICQRSFNFEPISRLKTDRSLMTGYWQSELFFKSHAKTISKEFTFIKPLSVDNSKFMQRSQDRTLVSVHIRRGDYLSASNLNQRAICDLDYYLQAAQLIKQKITHPTFVIFSDDLSWCKQNIHLGKNQIFVDWNQADSVQDLQLMTRCQHHIIVNSTFSWWGAWLNPSQKKIVVSPKIWLNNPALNTTDVIPKTWIKI